MTISEAAGLSWMIDPGDHDNLGPSHEPALTGHLLDLIPEGGTFLDVGAHVGHYALRAALIPGVRVIAVEPNPDTARRLRENIAVNELANVAVVEIAAWWGTQHFEIVRPHQQYVRDGSSRVVPTLTWRGPVAGARLDDALSQYPLRPDRLDVVKVDVEGADLQALDGMRGLLARHRPVLVIEDHSYLGYYDQGALLDLITYLGYQPAMLICDGATYWQCSPAPAPSSPG
jgi:FkbM family methyltransferase